MKEGISGILRERYGIEVVAGRRTKCPFCGKNTFSIKNDGSIGKCFHPACQKYITSRNG